MGDRLPQALEVARQISRYGGSVVVLIHPNILDHKLAFERGFVEGVRPYAWFGSVREFGRWWAARNQVEVDVTRDPTSLRVTLTMPQSIAGLTIELPEGWTLRQADSVHKGVTQRGRVIIFPELKGTHVFRFEQPSGSVASPHPSPIPHS